jgi:hypothetical protein
MNPGADSVSRIIISMIYSNLDNRFQSMDFMTSWRFLEIPIYIGYNSSTASSNKVGCYGQYVELIFFGIFKPEILNIMVIIGKMQLNFFSFKI